MYIDATWFIKVLSVPLCCTVFNFETWDIHVHKFANELRFELHEFYVNTGV